MKKLEKTINIGFKISPSYIYGPGKRFVIWVQGCSIHCKGCWNKQYWSFKGKDILSINEIINEIKKDCTLEGVTLLGGEPLDQADAVYDLIKEIKKLHLNVMLYTGYEKKEIQDNQLFSKIVAISDIVILGRYVKELRSMELRWRGSSNQEILINNPLVIKDTKIEERQEIEIHIEDNGQISILGYPTEEFLRFD